MSVELDDDDAKKLGEILGLSIMARARGVDIYRDRINALITDLGEQRFLSLKKELVSEIQEILDSILPEIVGKRSHPN